MAELIKIALVGHTNTGKTSLLRIAAALEHPNLMRHFPALETRRSRSSLTGS